MKQRGVRLVHEVLRFEFETSLALQSPEDVPNTFIPGIKSCAWRKHDFISYVLDPQGTEGRFSTSLLSFDPSRS